MYGRFSPVSMDTRLLLLSIVGYITMVTACPNQCQCNLDYFVYCRNVPIGDAELRSVMAEMPQKVRLLDLGFNSISILPAQIFSHLPHLQTLNLESNKISKISEGAFQNLPNLVELSLNNNVIHQLSPAPWGDVPGLKTLDLTDNYIDFIEPRTFTSLANLTELSLKHNQIGVLESQTLAGLSSLHSLDLSNNIIQRTDNGSFQDLNRLFRLDMSNNMLTAVHSGIFTGLQKLNTLILDYNKIADLSNLALVSFRLTLKSFQVSHNEVTSIPAGLFNNFHLLRELCLNHNKIESIARSSFINMDLDKLSVSNNKLTSLRRDMFGQIRRIRYLDFSYNRINFLSTGVFDSFRESVFEVRMEGNSLLYIDPGHFRGMIRIRILNLSDNLISIIKDNSFSDLRDLDDLILSGNDLEKVTPAMLSGIRLKRLFLMCNPLRQFSGFTYDDEDNPRRVHMNLTMIEQRDSSVRVRWPYMHGSQIYWAVNLVCLNSKKCPGSRKEEYLAPFKSEHTVEDLQPMTEYYLCVNPVFVDKDVHVEQCIKISSHTLSRTTESSIRVTDTLTSGSGHSLPGGTSSLIVIFTVLFWWNCFSYLH